MRFNPLRGRAISRKSWAQLVFATGALVVELALVVYFVVMTFVIGPGMWTVTGDWAFFGVWLFIYLSLFAQLGAAVVGAGAVLAGWIGRKIGPRAELIAVGVVPVALTSVVFLFVQFTPVAAPIAASVVVGVAYVLVTYWYRALIPESAESYFARMEAARVAAGEGES